jgi:predicted TIM-barrel fold metal-dependent hydrolase
MNQVVDVDSHWTFAWEFEPQHGPLAPFAGDLPDRLGLLAHFFAGDLIDGLPPEQRPRPEQLFPLPPGQKVPKHWERLRETARASDRIVWMDQVGIDFALVNPGGYGSAYPLIQDEAKRKAYIRTANDILVEATEGHAQRISPIAIVDIADRDGAIAEMTRMRKAGSRAFSIRTEPINGLSLAHKHFDPIWAAAVDLGMVVNVHVGNVPGYFGDWARVGWDFDDARTVGAFIRLANTQRHQSAEHFLNAMIYGGGFARHPNLSVVLSELWAGWLPNFVRQTEVFTAKGGPWGEWPFPLGGGDYLRRHVKLTPLPGLGDWNTLELIRELPEMVVFSSDYPHTEGNADPINLYGAAGLRKLPQAVQTGFLGATMQDCFARTGDPLAPPARAH